MPRKWSHACLLTYSRGAANSIRNQCEQRNGLSAGISRLENGCLPPSTTPGNDFRFSAQFGSRSVLSDTSAPTTVPGTSAECQPVAANPGVEMASPEERSTQDDCICQIPWRSN